MAVSLRELWCARDDSGAGDVEPDGRRRPPREVQSVSEPLSERDVIARIRAGDEAVFDALFRAEFPRLVGFGTALTGSQDVAEDVAGEVFTRIWCRHTDWNPRGPIGAYLFRAVHNQAENVRRNGRRAEAFRHSAEVATESPGMGNSTLGADVVLDHADAIAVLWRVVDALPEQRRAIAYLRWREGMDYEEIAEITGQSVAAVKMQLSRTLAALRRVVPGLID